MPKGPKFLKGNEQRHLDRLGLDWAKKCSEVDVDRLRVLMGIEYVRAKGGLTFEEKQELRHKISEIQKAKHKRESRLLGAA